MNQLSNRETDELGESIIRKYCKRFPSNSLCVNIEGFARDFLGLNIVYGSFAGPDEGTLGFLSNGKTSVWLREEDLANETVLPENTVVIDRSLLAPAESGRKRFTIAHEAAHYLLGQIRGTQTARYHRVYDVTRSYTAREMGEVLSVDENRVDRLAAAMLMPSFNVLKAFDRFAEGRKFQIYGDTIMSPEDKTRLQTMADGIGVSFSALKIRLRDMGLIEYHTFDEFVKQDLCEGDFDDSDIEYDRRYGHLTPEQIYLIHRSRREAERAEKREVPCPACGRRMTQTTDANSGYLTFKCGKCKFDGPVSLAYFRKAKRTGYGGVAYKYRRKNIR